MAVFCLTSCKAQYPASNNSIVIFENKCPDHFDQVMMWKKEFDTKPDTVVKLFAHHFINKASSWKEDQDSCLIGLKRSVIHNIFGQPTKKSGDNVNNRFEEYVADKEWTVESRGSPSTEVSHFLIFYFDLDTDTVVKYLYH